MKDYRTIAASDLGKGSRIALELCETEVDLYWKMAMEVAELIESNNQRGEPTVMIVPYGPLGPYARLLYLVNKRRISLKNCWFINMDEYLDDDKKWIPVDHPLSFHGFMERTVYTKIRPELIMPEEQRVFPDPDNVSYIPELIEKLGGVDIAFGGIGINGHVAFNEADPSLTPEEFLAQKTRVLAITPETRTANAIGDFGGALEDMPHYCVTIGIYEIAHARKIRLGVFRNWHRAVVRRTAYGEPSTDFPVSLLQNHPDITLTLTDYVAALAD